MATVSYHIANLLEKMTSSDKDFRFMATNDLMTELQKDNIKLDDDSERKVVKMLLRLLEDKNGEVQNLAVKCLGPLVNKVKEYQVETIVDILCGNMLSEKEQLRDISSIGLKTVISELPNNTSGLAPNVCKRITGKISHAIANQSDVSVQLEALDILADLLSRFGSLLVSFHPTIQDALLPQLASPRLAVRKRAIMGIGHLVLSCNTSLYSKLIDYLLDELSKDKGQSTTRTYIQCIGAVSRQSGHRFGEHLEKVIPLIVCYCEPDDDTGGGEGLDDELREHCLQAFEAFVRRCPKEITPHIDKILGLCLYFISHDPNYNYGDDGDGSMDTGEEDEESDDEYSDDDDMSWKVRRAAAKCLEAIISTRHEMLGNFYKVVSPKLIDQFKEREENVQSDIFGAYIALLKQTKPNVAVREQDQMDHQEGPTQMLLSQIPSIVRALHRHMKTKSIKTRQGCFSLLTELVTVLNGALSDHMNTIVPGIQYSLGEKSGSSNMKMDTLSFIHVLVQTHPGEVFHPHIPQLLPLIITAVKDAFYKITSEALIVTAQIVKVIRPLDTPSQFDFTPYTGQIYDCTLIRLKAADLDQEVKERAIFCMGQIIAHLGDHLQAELVQCLPIFLDRLRNEITRLTAVKALTTVAASPLHVDLRPVLVEAFPILSSFLRKNQRSLKLCTLSLLDTLIQNYSAAITPDMIAKVLGETPPLLSECDLHIAQLTLVLLTSIAKLQPHTLLSIHTHILPQILLLVRSPLLQGAALHSLLELFRTLVVANIPSLSYNDMLDLLISPITRNTEGTTVHKQAFHSIAKCVAALTVTRPSAATSVVQQLTGDIKKNSTDSVTLFALLAVGEIGRHIDLTCVPKIQDVILLSFSATTEEVKCAAAFALGSLSIGNLSAYLPFLLNEIQQQPRKLYLLLHSLKEIISHQSSSAQQPIALAPYIAAVWDHLFTHCSCPEEGTRNVVAECLGKLTLLDPPNLLPKLQQQLHSTNPLMRSSVVTAVKFTISDQPAAIDGLLALCIGDFLNVLEDSDLNVRRVALVAFNSAAHNKPSLIRDLLPTILPHLYTETKVRKELIREVEMGPFKHTVDDGLDIRKAAFECMYTLLDSCMDRLDIFEFLNHVELGLKDHYDIKMLTYLMLVRLANLTPTAVFQRLDRLVEPLRSTCTSKVKANSVKQEFEKQDELKRSAMRAITALTNIADADKNPGLAELVNHIHSSQELQDMYESIQKDASSQHADLNAMDLS